MPTLTYKAIYQNRVVIPEIHPPIALPTEAVVVFIPQIKNSTNASLVLRTLKRAKGILPKDIDGVEYENQIRKIASTEWGQRTKQNKL